MLTADDFVTWCARLNLSPQARAVVDLIRSSPPTRRVGGGSDNVLVRYPSRKMGVTIQAESHKNELPGIYEMEHSSAVLEYYDQPPSLKLAYVAKNGRRVGVLHTPDFFVLRTDSAGWEEWKTAADLEHLTTTMPARYQQDAAGQWRCPPGEAIAQPLGLYYHLRSSATIHWIMQRNLRFLTDYLRADCPAVPPEVELTLRALVQRQPGITLADALAQVPASNRDYLYTLLATEQLYTDLQAAPLAEPDRVHLFGDAATAQAYRLMVAAPTLTGAPTVLVAPGVPVVWDGHPWTIANVGETHLALLGETGTLLELPHPRFESLVAQGKLVGLLQAPTQDQASTALYHLFQQAQAADLREANRRYDLIRPVLVGQPCPDPTLPARTLRHWVARYRHAEQTLGCGYVGLLSKRPQSGNRTPRLAAGVQQALQEFVARYETATQKSVREIWGEFVLYCAGQGWTAPSYVTFRVAVHGRPRAEQVRQRAGKRAAYPYEIRYWELAMTTPRHGDRPWEIGHLDHTELDLELVDSRTGRNLGRPWATFLADAFTRRLLAIYLSFDPPSYRACMMAVRECVRRYGRLPQHLVVDGGAEFASTYFETLLARYEVAKHTRPPAQPRFGSVLERLFGTTNTEFVHNLLGNTQATRAARQLTPANDPKRLACWTLGTVHRALQEWAYEVYDTQDHPVLGQSPRTAFTVGLLQSGPRTHRLIAYDETFLLLTLPTTRKGTAKVQPGQGVRIQHLYYWADALRDPAVEGHQVPVRYDPFDAGQAYAYVRGQWVRCISEYYAVFQGRSEREIRLASEELRRRQQQPSQQFQVTATKLANFILSVEAEALLGDQRARDVEATDVIQSLSTVEQLPAPAADSRPPAVIQAAAARISAAAPPPAAGAPSRGKPIVTPADEPRAHAAPAIPSGAPDDIYDDF